MKRRAHFPDKFYFKYSDYEFNMAEIVGITEK